MFPVCKRELLALFSTPLGYAILACYLILSSILCFTSGNFLELNSANLDSPFFFWQPWILMVMAPGVAMRFWSDEWRSGTIELLASLPRPMLHWIAGKFLAAAIFWGIAIFLTFPAPLTTALLGSPDWGAVASGYLATFLTATLFSSLSLLCSAFCRDQVISLVSSISLCALLTLVSWPPFVRSLYQSLSPTSADLVLNMGVFPWFRQLASGFISLPALFYFTAIPAASLLATSWSISSRRR